MDIATVDGISTTGIVYKKNIYTTSAQLFIAENLNKIANDIVIEKVI